MYTRMYAYMCIPVMIIKFITGLGVAGRALGCWMTVGSCRRGPSPVGVTASSPAPSPAGGPRSPARPSAAAAAGSSS